MAKVLEITLGVDKLHALLLALGIGAIVMIGAYELSWGFLAILLFGMLILSFGLWGIGDIFRKNGVEPPRLTVSTLSVHAQNEMLATGTEAQVGRVTQAFLQMKKFDLATLQRAHAGR